MLRARHLAVMPEEPPQPIVTDDLLVAHAQRSPAAFAPLDAA